MKLYNEDCFDIFPSIPDKSIDMILCDLPYGITANSWDAVLPFDKLWDQYNRIIKDNGIIALFGSQPFSSMLVTSNIKMFRHEWIWLKNRGSNFVNTVREPMKDHEHILIFSKGGWTYNKQMQARSPSGAARVRYSFENQTAKSENYGKFDKVNNNQGELRVPSSVQKFNCDVGLHPTQKPVALLEYLIKTYTNEGDTVLDNCMGSGSTGVACMTTNRDFIGIEIEKKYFDIAKERIGYADKNRSLWGVI